MTVIGKHPEKSSTEYTRVLGTTSKTKTKLIDDESTAISDTTDRQSANEVNKSQQNKFNFSNTTVEQFCDFSLATSAVADEESLLSNGVNTGVSNSFKEMNSKNFVPFSEKTLKHLPISVRIEEEQPVGDCPVSGRSPDGSSHTPSPSRPTTLSVCQSIPPEFSISPADSLSKASSSDNIPESSTTPSAPPQAGPHFQRQSLCAKQSLSSSVKPPPSPTNLSVHNFNGTGGYYGWGSNTPLALSPSFNSLHGSLASSINDLTVEAEQLERAIRHNDTRFVRRMLELHNRKGNTSFERNDSLIDKISRSSQNLDMDAKDPNKQLLKSQSMIDKYVILVFIIFYEL